MALGVGHRPQAIVFFLTGGIPQVEAVLLALILPQLVVILENSRFVVFRVRIAFEDKEHAGLADRTITDGNNSKGDRLLGHWPIVAVWIKNSPSQIQAVREYPGENG
jgi:hypothetical protein